MLAVKRFTNIPSDPKALGPSRNPRLDKANQLHMYSFCRRTRNSFKAGASTRNITTANVKTLDG